MAVYRLFRNEPFEPEAIVSMTRVYADVCRMLGLSDTDHNETNVVAAKVIEFAQRGARDPILLRDCVLEALRGSALRPCRPATGIISPITIKPSDAEIDAPIHADHAGILRNRIINRPPGAVIDDRNPTAESARNSLGGPGQKIELANILKPDDTHF